MKEIIMTGPRPNIEAIKVALEASEITIDWLAGDGSDRCYFRLTSPEFKESFVIMMLAEKDYIDHDINDYEWIVIANELSTAGIQVPKVRATIPSEGLVIIEDYGDIMLETHVLQSVDEPDFFKKVKPMYQKGIDLLETFSGLEPRKGSPWTERRFDLEKLDWELRFFKQMYLENCCSYEMDDNLTSQFLDESQKLCKYLESLPTCFVHRDFHSRNLMVREDELAVIDFQDARFGPHSYDLVSLIFDSYVPFSIEQRRELLDEAISRFRNLLNASDFIEFQNSIYPMLIQRQIKAIGSFGYLSSVKGKHNFMSWVPTANQILKDVIKKDERWPFLSEGIFEIIDNCYKSTQKSV
jgi:aminoglycoside/choline kinase family phosphotransferase